MSRKNEKVKIKLRDFSSKRISRREAISTAGKIAISAVVAGVVAGVGGYYAGSAAAAPRTVEKTIERTVTQTVAAAERTVTATVTAPGTTMTVTAPATTVTTTTTVTAPIKPREVVLTIGASNWLIPDEEVERRIKEQIMSKVPEVVDIKFELMAGVGSEELHKIYATWLSAGKKEPDILWTDVVWAQMLGEKGWLEPLNKYITLADKDKFFDSAFYSYALDGTVYGLRAFADVPFLYARKSLLKEFGFKFPETYEELVNQAKTIIAKYPDMYGFLFWGTRSEGMVLDWYEIFTAFGGRLYDDKGNVILDSPEGIAGTQFMVDLIYKYKITPPEIINMDVIDIKDAYIEGKAAFIRNWAFVAGEASNPKVSKIVDDWITGPNPKGPAGIRAHNIGGWAFSINAFSDKKDVAAKAILALTADVEFVKEIWVLHIGWSPALKELIDPTKHPEVSKKYPQYGPTFKDVIETAILRPYKRWPEVCDVLAGEIHAALAGAKKVEDALHTAAREIARILGTKAPYAGV
jgi:multiple sugar transport system substrate-binding protein